MNVRASDTILGAVTTTAFGSGVAWIVNSPILGAIGTIATFSLAAIGWMVMKREKQEAAARNKWVADALAGVQVSLVNVQVNQVLTADMMQRLHASLHPETSLVQPTVIQTPATPAEEKKP